MKKYLYIAIAAATFASCSQDEVMDFNQEAISFGSAFVDNTPRAAVDPSYQTTDTTKTTHLNHFNVYGTVNDVNIYSGQAVTKGNAGYGTPWTIAAETPTQYWIAGAYYIFDAVVDATNVTTDTNTGLPTSLNYKASTQKDMLHNRVTTTGKPTTNNGLVAFTFTHLLSKVKFTVVNNTASVATNYRYTITDINLTNTITEGNCAIPNYKWSTVSTGTHAIADMTIASATTEECATEILLIPTAKVGISFKVNVQIKKGDSWETITTTNVTKQDVVTLAANTAYNFEVTVGLEDEIKFTALPMPTWENGNTQDSNADNVNDYIPAA